MASNNSGMPPEHSQTLLGHFWKKSFFVKNLEKRPKGHETSMGRKTVFFLGNHENNNDVHRHDSNFGGRMAFPSSIWSPFVKKRVLAKTIDFTCNCCARTRFLCMHENLVHAQESCACTRILCMHKNLVHAHESCACTTAA